MYHLQFSLQAASPEKFGYTLVCYGDSGDKILAEAYAFTTCGK